jgi:hypothetical protein
MARISDFSISDFIFNGILNIDSEKFKVFSLNIGKDCVIL